MKCIFDTQKPMTVTLPVELVVIDGKLELVGGESIMGFKRGESVFLESKVTGQFYNIKHLT